ncbi:MAG: hypothetical protein PHX51_08485 [Clostridia bacterium]|nr:hypothetical protein [Clostridia bacterium]
MGKKKEFVPMAIMARLTLFAPNFLSEYSHYYVMRHLIVKDKKIKPKKEKKIRIKKIKVAKVRIKKEPKEKYKTIFNLCDVCSSQIETCQATCFDLTYDRKERIKTCKYFSYNKNNS